MTAIADLLMLLLGLFGALFSFLSSFPLILDGSRLMWGCLLLALASVAVFSLPKWQWGLTLAWLGCIGWMVWENFKTLSSAALSIAERVGGVFAERLSLLGLNLVAPDFPAQLEGFSLAKERAAVTLLFLLVAALLVLWLGWAVVARRSFWPGFFATFPFLLAPLTITVTPAALPLGALLLFWTAGLMTRLVKHKGRAKLTFMVLPSAALLLLLLNLALPRNAAWIPAARADFQQKLFMVGQGITMPGGPLNFVGLGPSTEVNLRTAGPLRYAGSTVLRVESEITGHIYLRGFSAAKYTGTDWEQLSEEDYQAMPGVGEIQPINFPALIDQAENPEGGQSRFSIESLGLPTGYVYTPYHLSTTPEHMAGAEFVGDAYLTRTAAARTFILYARTGASPENRGRGSGILDPIERAYSSFVTQHYLDVPEELRETLAGVLRENHLLPPNDGQIYYVGLHDPVSAARQVADLLSLLTVYDPETPVTPAGADFVGHFLTTSKRGYCMHYASAATLLLRMMGVPARYVTGYTADVKAGTLVSVPDKNAHAWVEVYVDGYGWEPVEVTSGFSGQSAAAAEATPTPTTTPSETPAPTVTPSATPSQSAAPTAPSRGEPGGFDWKRLIPYVLTPAAVALAVWLIKLRRTLVQKRRLKRFAGADANRAVIAMYVYQQRLLRLYKDTELAPEAEALGQKAKFSRHTLTERERQAMADHTAKLTLWTDTRSDFWRRLILRYFWCLT